MSTNLFSLEGRTALVTGSSRGLGRSMAEGLAAAGAAVQVEGFAWAVGCEHIEAIQKLPLQIVGCWLLCAPWHSGSTQQRPIESGSCSR